MKRFAIYSFIAFALVSCNKNKFKTQPQVQSVSLSPSSVYKGQIFKFKGTVTDKEGDATDSAYIVTKEYSIPTNFLLASDTLRYVLSDFGVNNDQYELEVDFIYGEQRDNAITVSTDQVDRNYSVGLIIVDKAGHKSDYVESSKILLQKL
jgi:hypothetical protein